MKRIEKTFAELKKKGDKALVAYITAGYVGVEPEATPTPTWRRRGA